MFRYINRHNRILSSLNGSLKQFPISFSHFKLYFLRTIKQYNYALENTGKRPAKPPVKPVENGIAIYKMERAKFFRKLSFFSVFNFSVWTVLDYSVYRMLMDIPADTEVLKNSWLGNEKVREIIKKFIIMSLILGFFLVISTWLYIMRCIKSITLLEQSKQVLFETYTPISTVKSFVVPLKDVSGVISRHKVKMYIPLKIKNRIFYFLVDTSGKFLNPSLFDSSIALKRDLRK